MKHRTSERGFTLVELAVVLLIIGGIATLVADRTGDLQQIAGGGFEATGKTRLLITAVRRDYANRDDYSSLDTSGVEADLIANGIVPASMVDDSASPPTIQMDGAGEVSLASANGGEDFQVDVAGADRGFCSQYVLDRNESSVLEITDGSTTVEPPLQPSDVDSVCPADDGTTATISIVADGQK